jgi:hypothetical protein
LHVAFFNSCSIFHLGKLLFPDRRYREAVPVL